MKKHIKNFKIITIIFIPYMMDFIIFPLILSSFKGYIITYTSIIFKIIFSLLGMIFLTDKLHYWLLGDVTYYLLATLYHPTGIYGIGMLGISFVNASPSYDSTSAWLGITICTIGSFLIQFAVWICFKIFKAIKAYLKKEKR